MGIIFESEVSNEGIVNVLQHVQQYLPKSMKERMSSLQDKG